jgi:hypothetical protein
MNERPFPGSGKGSLNGRLWVKPAVATVGGQGVGGRPIWRRVAVPMAPRPTKPLRRCVARSPERPQRPRLRLKRLEALMGHDDGVAGQAI